MRLSRIPKKSKIIRMAKRLYSTAIPTKNVDESQTLFFRIQKNN